MAVIQNLDVRLRAITGAFSKGMKSAQGTLSRFSSAVSSIGGFALKAGGLFATAAAAIGAAGVKVAANWETQATQFEIMLGSAEKAKKLMAELQKFSDSTPFQFEDVAKASASLLSYGVAADDVMNRVKGLGDIAAGSNSRLAEVVNVVGKAYQKNAVSLETLNQLAERGIPIYGVLKDQMGVTANELGSMASAGKISFEQLETGLKSMTEGSGIFAGALEKQSQTMAGLFSTLKGKVTLVLGNIGQTLNKVFDFKAIITKVTEFAQSVADKFQEWEPAIEALKHTLAAYWEYVKEIFNGIFNTIKEVFASIFEQFGLFQDEGASWQETVITILASLEFYFKNWKDVLSLVMTEAALAVVKFYENFKAILKALPTILVEYGKFSMKFWTDLGGNVANALKEIWDYIKSGGTDKINITWKPLSDGFNETMDNIANAVKRDKSGLEKALEESANTQRETLSKGLQETIDERLQLLRDAGKEEINEVNDGIKTKVKTDVKAEVATKIENPGAILKGSAEAFSAIATFKNQGTDKNSPEQKMIDQQKETNKKLEQVVKVLNDKKLPAAGLV